MNHCSCIDIDEPKEDEDYILAKIKVKVSNVKDDKKISISPVSFDIYSGDNVEYDNLVFTTEPVFGKYKTEHTGT